MAHQLKQQIMTAIEAMGGRGDLARKSLRGAQVRSMWRELMVSNKDEAILHHTNAVFIYNPDQQIDPQSGRRLHGPRRGLDDTKDADATGRGKRLVVYVDDSIVAAELNARRELIKMQFLGHFGEEIDEFKICLSRGRYRANHPFAEEAPASYEDPAPSVALSQEERVHVHEQVQQVEDEKLRELLEQTMVVDLEWKKGIAATRAHEGFNPRF